MVKTIMSTDGSESEQTDSLTKTKDKLKVQQRLIDISARNLQSTRGLSSRDFSGSGTVTPGSGVGEGQSAIEENIRLLENKLLKNFSNQLLLKHQCLKQLEDEEEYAAVTLEKVKSELDQLISLEQFLNITGLEAKSTKALLSDILTLDSLFLMAPSDLEQMLVKHDINPDDSRRLVTCLDQLNSFYEMWQRGEKPSVTSYDRLGSTTSSRLGSMGSMDQDYRYRTDSASSTFLMSTTGAQSSSASTTPTPLTPSSSQSLLSPSPFTGGSASGTITPTQIPTPPPATSNNRFNMSGNRGLNRGQSCSTTVLLSDVESPTRRQLSHSHHSTSSLSDPKAPVSGVKLRRKPALTHKRSLSNPLHNIIPDMDASDLDAPNSSHIEYNHQNSNYYVSNDMSSGGGSQYNVYQQQYHHQHHYPLSHRSPSPPSRAGSQPSVYVNSVGGSPSSLRHPQMRRIAATTPEFSVSIPNDEMMYPTPRSGYVQLSGSESVLHRQNTWQGPDEFPPPMRCYSYAGQRKSDCTQPVYNEMTSASMVDLPMKTGYALSSEHLDQIEEYLLPSSGKSQSVPRLTLMSIDKGVPSTSAPTSPRTPSIYTPTGHMGHAIMHRFTVKTYKPHICDYCKKTVMMGVKCKHCKYRCHKGCAEKAPHSCGLPRELIEYFRKQVVLTSTPSPSTENFVSPSDGHSVRPPLQKVSTISEPDSGKENDFVIQELSKEPSKTQFSPIMGTKRHCQENGRRRYELSSQTSSTSLLEVPHPHIRSGYRSTSSSPSPSTSPPTSPSLTPSSPRSPNECVGGGMMGGGHNYSRYNYPSYSSSPTKYIRVVFTDESGDESCDDHMTSDSSAFSSKNSSTNDISDLDRVRAVSPTGLRPPPQVVAAHSLPDLLNIGSSADHMDSGGKFISSTISNGYVSDESFGLGGGVGGGSMPKIRRKESVQRTLSTADSRTSTLVNSLPTEEDDFETDSLLSSQGDVGESFRQGARVVHRNSIIDEWSIPYKSVKIVERVGRGPVAEVYRGYWHGEVAIKRFSMPDASPDQINRFKEEVAILKKTRHENLALFMGASLTAPDLAIVTSFCKGRTLYTYIHMWSEPFALERSVNIGRQVAQAMGYLHARGIVHKDLNTKNIFLEKDKVVITDTGLSSLSDNIWIHRPQVACEKGYFVIPRTKLYYLAPEILRVLSPCPEVADPGSDLYPYSEKTDIFAFGTVMYELLSRKFPFMTDIFGLSMDPSVLVYLVGTGRRPEMQSREIPKRVKDLVLQCWHQEPRQRLPFSTINEVLIKLSRKKTPISRSPSFPISLSRSSESLNFLK